MSGLGLVPNEVVGYRVVADTYSWNVVLIKKHGKDSKQAGQEYAASTLGYYKDVKSALLAVMDRAMKEHLMSENKLYIGQEEQWIAALEAGRKAVEQTAAGFEALMGENREGYRKYLRAISHNTALSGLDQEDEQDDEQEA